MPITANILILKELKKRTFSDYFNNMLINELDYLIKASLKEDLNEIGDVTSQATITNDKKGKAIIIAKQEGIFAGGFIMNKVFEELKSDVSVSLHVTDGCYLKSGQEILELSGSIKSILTGERTVLNFISRMSGVATLTNQFVEIVKDSHITILDTRKTLPGWRYLDKYSVKIGGGKNHRIGLFDMFLIKENHITVSGGIKNAVLKCREFLRERDITLPIEVETRNLEEVKQALEAKVDRIMFDNMSVQQITQAVKLVERRAETEISGGVNINNIKSYINTGVDYISIGSLTHSAKSFDYSLLLTDV